MARIRISVLQPSINATIVEVPDDVVTATLISALIKRLNCPERDKNGNVISYRLTYTSNGEEYELEGHQTLAQLGIQSDDVLRLQADTSIGSSWEATSEKNMQYPIENDLLKNQPLDSTFANTSFKQESKSYSSNSARQFNAQGFEIRLSDEERRRLVQEISEAVTRASGSLNSDAPSEYDVHTSELQLSDEERRRLVQEISEAIEVLNIQSKIEILEILRTTKQEREFLQDSFLVRPVFGRPSDHHQFECFVFMIMPFAPPFKKIYTKFIKSVVVDEFKLTIHRGDEFVTNLEIMHEVWSALMRCEVVIADCTGRNPNVFYELGIAHTLGKRTILISQSEDDVPFNVKGKRVIFYKNDAEGLANLQDELREALDKILQTISDVDQPPV